jgi:hypothetical protein
MLNLDAARPPTEVDVLETDDMRDPRLGVEPDKAGKQALASPLEGLAQSWAA